MDDAKKNILLRWGTYDIFFFYHGGIGYLSKGGEKGGGGGFIVFLRLFFFIPSLFNFRRGEKDIYKKRLDDIKRGGSHTQYGYT